MKRETLVRPALVIVALLVTALSIMLGPRHIGYILAAVLSATLIWGVVSFLNEQKRRAGMIAGVIAGLVVQQVAYQVWKAELPGFWWPLAQFGALQFLVGYGIGRSAP
jgi:Na+/proline symporter